MSGSRFCLLISALRRPHRQRSMRAAKFERIRSADRMPAGAAAAVRLPLNALADYHMSVNCQPARRQCLPVIVPAQAIVRAGNGGVMRNYELPHRHCRDPGTRKDPPNSNLWFRRVVLYSDVTYTLQRPDSKRPQAVRKMWKPALPAGLHARSGVAGGTAGRVACAKRRGSGTAASLASLRAAVGLC